MASDPTARLQQALADHRAGRLDQAEAVYRSVLAADPGQSDALHLLGLARLQRGNASEAAELIQRAVAAAPNRSAPYHDLGEALKAVGDRDGARHAYARAVTLAPNFALAHYSLANLLVDMGDPAAEASYEAALANEPRFVPAYNNLGNLLQRSGRYNAAIAVYDRAIQNAEVGPETHYNRANALEKAGRQAEAIEAYRRTLMLDPGFAPAHVNLANVQLALGRFADAVDSMGRAVTLDPAHLGRRRDYRQLVARLVPFWHFPMMNDEGRNAAYARAFARHVTPDTHVLEIGTGGGLLAMLAARAGAKLVTTCEAVPLIADTARRIIAANGLSARITVIAKPSTALQLGEDLAAPADLLISEILSSEFIGEGSLTAIDHAMRVLMKPGARSIPMGGAVLGCLVGGNELERHFFAGRVDGFDLSLFNALLSPAISLRLPDYAFDCLSEPVELAQYRLPETGRPVGPRSIDFPVTRAGRCLGVAQWIRIDLDEQERFDNDPRRDIGRASSGWQHLLYTLTEPIMLEPGQTLRFQVEEAPDKLLIDRPVVL